MKEIEDIPNPNYSNNFEEYQKNLTWFMRAILIDWMMEVCKENSLKRSTFHISINFVDRYLSIIQNIPKRELQLIGLTSMYLASKIEV